MKMAGQTVEIDSDCVGARHTLRIMSHLINVGLINSDVSCDTVASPAMGYWGTCPLDFQI